MASGQGLHLLLAEVDSFEWLPYTLKCLVLAPVCGFQHGVVRDIMIMVSSAYSRPECNKGCTVCRTAILDWELPVDVSQLGFSSCVASYQCYALAIAICGLCGLDHVCLCELNYARTGWV